MYEKKFADDLYVHINNNNKKNNIYWGAFSSFLASIDIAGLCVF